MRSVKVMRKNPNTLSSADLLPFDLILEILTRLPVKSLLQFRCVSKSWNLLISDPKFARKHLNLSTTPRRVLRLSYDTPSYRYILNSYSLQSIFTDADANFTQFEYPLLKRSSIYYAVGSCDGILCFANHPTFTDYKPFVVLWNPSIAKFKELPPFENLSLLKGLNWVRTSYGFGYDHVSHDYKVVVIYNPTNSNGVTEGTTQAKVYTLNTDSSWRTIQPFPFGINSNYTLGRYVCGSMNWMSYNQLTHRRCIVSLDLGDESYQIILPPTDLKDYLRLSVLRDCLCIISDHDVWLMEEYGIQDSWTKLFNVTHLNFCEDTITNLCIRFG
ncbi:F-box/kelch-repeat protein At3g23880-like [Vicia villosa]|uniref:F-box/kelch-repeat protein At3g23880-like n=1 Tax=Vicia villosa TaxID=3911 RepID=UPI00273C4A64|nr:F-box/kelch-repeat protein At3g23880-like [Vicia villosa]